MKLCFVSQEDVVAPQGGTGTYVRNISMIMASKNHEVHVISRKVGDQPDYEIVNKVHVHRVTAPGPAVLYSPLFFRESAKKYKEIEKRVKFDLIHSNLPLMSSWGLQDIALPPVIETVHCTVREELKSISHRSLLKLNLNEVLTRFLSPVVLYREKKLVDRAKKIICVSEGLKRELYEQHEDLDKDRAVVIPNGIHFNKFSGRPRKTREEVRTDLGIDLVAPVVLYLGRLVERKRAIDLVRALPSLIKNYPNIKLVIVGKRNKNADRISSLVRELDLSKHVIFCDHLAYDQVPSFYSMADVYALPSEYEGFPFTILEAMASGTPVVASAIPGITDQITHDQTGILHPVADIEGISNGIYRILSNQALSTRLSTNARAMVKEKYTWEVIGSQTEKLFEDVLD